jgi:BMFP domain-containing protein YqiC
MTATGMDNLNGVGSGSGTKAGLEWLYHRLAGMPRPLAAAPSASHILAVKRERPGGFSMTQTTSRFFDEVARLMNDAAGVAQGVRREVDTLFKSQAERWLRDLDLVKREEFEAVKDMARLAREENEALKVRIAALEAAAQRPAAPSAPPSSPSPGETPPTL